MLSLTLILREPKRYGSSYDDGVYIFILPPSLDALKERLEKTDVQFSRGDRPAAEEGY